ncbi:MAG: hypothetical protein IKL55_01720, partial [Clostridia bacterium]|nr:hypothetical protein [Clostridia bacterium]
YNSSVQVLADKTCYIFPSISTEEERYIYYPKMTFKINIPYYTDSEGNKHYLNFNIKEITNEKNFDGWTVKNVLKYSSYEINTEQLTTNGMITLDIYDVYGTNGYLFAIEIEPLSEELLQLEQNEFVFSDGYTTISVDGKNGITGSVVCTTNIYSIIYQKEVLEKIRLDIVGKNVTYTNRPEDAVSVGGAFHIENTGTGDSCEKTIYIEYDIEDTNLINVTTTHIPSDTVQEYIELQYTLVDVDGKKVYLNEDGERVEETAENAVGEWKYSLKNAYYNSTALTQLKNKFIRTMLPTSHQQYYFKTIKYKLKTIKVGQKLWTPGSSCSFTDGGTVVGYFKSNAKNNKQIKTRITIESSNPNIDTLTGIINTTLKEESSIVATITNIAMSETTINAGNSVTVSGNVSVASFPYGSSTWLKDISIGVILPKDVSINEQTVSITTGNGISIKNFVTSNRETEDGNVLWTIKLPTEVYLGYSTQTLGILNNYTTIKFKMQLETAYTMNNSTLYAKDMFIVAGYNQKGIKGQGGYSGYERTDIYDLNENGLTTDLVSGARNTITDSCQIIPQTATLDISNSISIDSQGSITQEGTKQSIQAETDIVNYNIDIGCSTGGTTENFEYYIPIPKTTSSIDNFLISSEETKLFDFNLVEEAAKTGDDLFDLQYSFETGINYETAKELQTWYTAEEIESNENLLWENVTLIKLTSKTGRIENGSNARISVRLKYAGDDYENDAGMKNVWHAGGYYHYNLNGREVSGNYNTNAITVNLECILELEEITLTAAPDMAPKTEGNVNTITVERNAFPQFKNSHIFSITAVEAYNVILQNKEYIQANVDMTGNDANKTFAVTVNMDASEKDVLTTAQTTPIEVGISLGNSAPEFTYKIYNANELSDNSQIRYIIVTITSDNGVTIKQRININREIKQATDPKSAIAVGKRFVMFDDTTEEVTISQDSAFTTQFVLNYIPDLYNGQSISFSNNLPVGTKIILAELTNSDNPMYYYYQVGSVISTIDIQDFIAMGTTQTKNYTLSTGADTIEEKFLVIVDFSGCSSGYIDTGNYTIKMILESSNDSVEDFNSKELTFITKGKRRFELTVPQNANFGKKFEISYVMQDTEGAESKYDGRKLSLIMNAPDNISPDINLSIENEKYYLNANKQFIIPLNEISNLTDSLTIQMNSEMLPDTETQYVFEVELWVSATSNANLPMLGEKVGNGEITIVTEGKVNPALKVTNMNKRVLHKKDLGENLETTFEYVTATNCSVTVELQQKVGTAYQKVTDRLNQVNNTTNHTFGVFNVSSTEGINKVTMRLSSAITSSTYRLLFKVKNSQGEELLTIPYNFIVANDK